MPHSLPEASPDERSEESLQNGDIMSTAVVYYSKGGNTKKLAEAAAQAAGVAAQDTSVVFTEKIDMVFLGSSLYAGGFADEVRQFLVANAGKIGMLICFGSSASGKSTYNKIRPFAQEKGIQVSDQVFNCPGHFLFMNKNRPGDKDLAALQNFVKKQLEV